MVVIAVVVCADPIQLFGSRGEDPLLLFKLNFLLFSFNTFSGIDDTLKVWATTDIFVLLFFRFEVWSERSRKKVKVRF